MSPRLITGDDVLLLIGHAITGQIDKIHWILKDECRMSQPTNV